MLFNMEYFSILRMILCYLCTATVHTRDHTGKTFVVAFFRNLDLTKFDAYVMLAATGEVNVTCTVTDLSNPQTSPSSFQIRPGYVQQFSFQKQFGKINVPFPVIGMGASHPISITAFVDGPMSAASYLAFPLDVAGKEYRMMPFCEKSRKGLCVCTIVTLMANTFMMLENENNGYVSVFTSKHGVRGSTADHTSKHGVRGSTADHTSKHGVRGNTADHISKHGARESTADHTSEHAARGSTADHLSVPHSHTGFSIREIYSHVSLESRGDFTGLLLRANNSLVVFCGGMVEDSIMSMEQIPSVQYFGLSFYVFTSLHSSVPPSKIRFISHYNCTKIQTVNVYTLDAGEFQEISISHLTANSRQIKASKPIAIMQVFSGSKANSRGLKYEEGLLLLPATEQYVSTVVIPRRKRKSMTSFRMILGFVYEMCFNYTLSRVSNDQPFQKNFMSQWISNELDDDGTSIRITLNASRACRNGNSFGVYIYRRNWGDISISMSGYQFLSKRIETRHYLGKPCGSQYFKMDVLKSQSPALEATSAIPELTPSDVISLTTEYSDIATEEISKKQLISTTPRFQHCICHPKPSLPSSTQIKEELQDKIKEIKEDLAINKQDLSSYRRKKTSANDDRTSAKGIGMVGASILCAFATFIFIMDVEVLIHQGSALWRKTFGRHSHTGARRNP